MPDMSVTLPMLTDVGLLPEFKMAATTSGFAGRHLEFRLSADVISTSGLAVAILNFGNEPTSGNVGSVRSVSGMVANVWVTVRIVSPAHFAQ